MDKLNILKDLGLSDKEIIIYTRLLSIGPMQVSLIAKGTMIKRPTTYFVLEKLVEKGLVSKTEKNKKEVFKAEDPKILLGLVKEQAEKVINLQKSIANLIPQLKNSPLKKSEELRIRILQGKEGLWSIAEDTLKVKKDIYVIGSGQQLCEIYSENRINDYGVRRQIRKIQCYVLTDQNPTDIKWYLSQRFGFLEYRFLPSTFKINAYFVLYGKKSFLISNKQPLTGVVIEDDSITEVLKLMFEALWKELKGKNLPVV